MTRTADPLAGSYYVEALTAALEERARALLAEVEKRGGAARAVAEGFVQQEIARSAYLTQQAIERGDEVVVGLNKFVEPDAGPNLRAPDYRKLAAKQVTRLKAARKSRHQAKARTALAAVAAAAGANDAPLMEPILEAVRARATLGEISLALESAWGRHDRS